MKLTSLALLSVAVALLASPHTLFADTYDRREYDVVSIAPSSITPAPAATATGRGLVRLHTRRNSSGQLTAAAIWAFASVAVTESRPTWLPLRLMEGASGQTGTRIFEFGPSPRLAFDGRTTVGSPSDPSAITDLPAVERLLANPQRFHLLLATQANPNGIGRGQLRAVPEVFLGTVLRPSNLVPPLALDASGECWIRFRDFGDSIQTDVFTAVQFPTGARTTITNFQIHSAAQGENGPNLVDLRFLAGRDFGVTGSDGVDIRSYPKQFSDPASIEALRNLMASPQGFYLQMTTSVNPSGALRGQFRRTETIVHQIDMKPENVVPAPQGLTANGVVRFRAFLTRDPGGAPESVAFARDGWLQYPSEQFRLALPIHEGAAGVSGPAVLLPDPLSGRLSPYSGTPQQVFDNYGSHFLGGLLASPGRKALLALLANPAGYYIQVYSTALPNGFLRGQIGPAAANLPAVASRGIINAAGAAATAAAAPRGLTSLFGSNLATSTGVVPLTAAGELAEQFNGTEVTVGGLPAKLLFASPGQLNIQIPEVAPGRHRLQVKTPAGNSTALDLDVTPTAPGIFVITKADFSLITEASPVAVGDPVILWTTGLGNSNPRVAPGVTAPADPLSIPATPEVLFGDAPGVVAAVALAPGFAGVEQVVAVVSGSAGPVEVRLRSGGATSNPVTIHIR